LADYTERIPRTGPRSKEFRRCADKAVIGQLPDRLESRLYAGTAMNLYARNRHG
jgi:hypothetical protein